jgi:hypothetical protein
MTRLVVLQRVLLVMSAIAILAPPGSRATLGRALDRVGTSYLLGAAPQTPEPPHYPPGEYCEHPDERTSPMHPCFCKVSCESSPETPAGHNDPHCGQYCHADSCACEMKGCP